LQVQNNKKGKVKVKKWDENKTRFLRFQLVLSFSGFQLTRILRFQLVLSFSRFQLTMFSKFQLVKLIKIVGERALQYFHLIKISVK